MKLILFAASLLVSSLASNPESEQHFVRSTPYRNVPKQASACPLFDLLPLELVLQVLHQVPFQSLLFVCRQWTQLTQERRMTSLRCLLMTPYFERRFKSEEGRDRAFTKVIVSYLAEPTSQVELENDGFWSESSVLSNLPVSMSIDCGRETRRLAIMLPRLSSSDPKARLMKLLAGADGFSQLPLDARRFIAAKCVWKTTISAKPTICSLGSFLSSFHADFDSFKDALVNVDSVTLTKACIGIVLGVDCAELSMQDRASLILSIMSVVAEDSLPAMACSLHGSLSPDSTIPEIFKVVQYEHPALVNPLTDVLQVSPEHVTANWCMTKLNRASFGLASKNLQCSLLFCGAFLKKHGISEEDRDAVLKSCKAVWLLKSLPADLTVLDTQALVKWVNDHTDESALSLSSLVTICYLDDDLNALSKYYKSLSSANHLQGFAEVALDIDCAQHPEHSKKIALLECLDPEKLADFAAVLNGDDRKALVAKVVSSVAQDDVEEFVGCMSDSDFSLLVQTCLDHPETHEMPILEERQENLAARTLVKYIGDDTSKLANLKQNFKECQAKVLLWTDCDAVAACLGEILDADLEQCFATCVQNSSFESQEEASRAARRMHEHHRNSD